MSAGFVPIMWTLWGVVAIVTVSLYAYRSTLTRDEEGQIFLDPAFDHEKAVQSEIVSKVNRLQPAVRISLALTLLMSLVMIVYYTWDAAKLLL